MLFKKKISSPFGKLIIVASDTGVQSLLFENELNSLPTFKDLKVSKNHPILFQCKQELYEYFKGRRLHFSVPLEPQGTDFQKKVWSALEKIPFGKTISYSEQAQRMRRNKSVRAVAAANGRNPIPIIIPCHRVIASTGHLHGYAGGLDLKRKLLEFEGVKISDWKATKQEAKYYEEFRRR